MTEPIRPAFRTGTHNPRNIYRVAGTGNHLDDTHFAVAIDEDDGELIATALSAFSAALEAAPRRLAGPQLAKALRNVSFCVPVPDPELEELRQAFLRSLQAEPMSFTKDQP